MKTLLTTAAFLLIASIGAFGQRFSVRGSVQNREDDSPLPGANVLLIRPADSLTVGTVTDVNGLFSVNKVGPGMYYLRVSFLGFETQEQAIRIEKQSIDLDRIRLKYTSTHLKEVQVKGKTPPTVQNGDTTQFNASAFKTQPDATAEDLLRKMPGMDMSSGTVKTQGEEVVKVLVDGKPFFGDDPNAALRNLPAEVVDKIQVYDQRSEQAQFTGFDDGQTSKTINIVTKPDKRLGQFGKVYAGYGYDNKYQLGGNLNVFKGDQRISVLAQANNINIQNFSAQDLVGLGGSGGRGRGGRGRGEGSAGSGAGNFMVGQQSGISGTQSAGINYSDKWGTNTDVTGSYFFNRNENLANQFTFRNYVLPSDSGQVYQEGSLSSSVNYNHRVNLRIDHRIDSANSLLIRPSFSLQQNQSLSYLSGQTYDRDSLLNQTENNFYSGLTGYNFVNEALFRHKFAKPRRTFSFSLNTGYNRTQGNSDLNAQNTFYDGSVRSDTIRQNADMFKTGWNASGNASYTEPLGKNSMLQLNYTAALQQSQSARNTYQLSEETNTFSRLDSALTNTFQSRYLSQRLGTSYRFQENKLNFTLGVNYQWAQMQNNQVLPRTFLLVRTFQNLLPTAVFQYKFSGNQNLNLTYRTSTSQPSVDQLQNVIINTNPIQLSTGNPDLRQTYQHSLTLRYSSTNIEKSNTTFLFLSGNYANNFITNSTFIAENDSTLSGGIVLKRGAQLIRPINLDGNWSLRSLVTYGLPVGFLKSNLNLNASFNYTRTPGLINERLNFSNTQTLGLGVVLSSNISEKVDFTVSSNSSFNLTQNTLQSSFNRRFLNQNTRVNFNLTFWKGLVYQTTLNHQINSGLSAGYNQNFMLLNMSIAKKFMKKNQGELKLSVYDLLNQNNSIQRNVTATYMEDVQTQVLQRYFMLTFTYNLQHFKK